MAMVVKNNMSAVKTLNVLNANSAALAKDLRQVATGMKVNSAADDNSGYAISERMQVRIRALNQADQNTQNGANMLKVAEGAVSSTVDILKTMKEKAINAANDSNTDADRATIQKELDQSIDQIDDNALITYNSKTLVDGSRMAKGVATKTSLTNQSLSEDTKGATKLVDLKNRNGEGLNIQTTDSLNISYVIQGRTYTTDIDIDENITLQEALDKAARTYYVNSPVGSQIEGKYNSSMKAAEVKYNDTMAQAEVTYNATLDQATVQAVTGYTGNNLKAAIAAAENAVNKAQGVINTAKEETITKWGTGYDIIKDMEDDDFAASTAGFKYTSEGEDPQLAAAADTNHQTTSAGMVQNKKDAQNILDQLNQEYKVVDDAAKEARKATEDQAQAVRDQEEAAAWAEYADSLGELTPYDLVVDTGNVVGKAASGDTVYTANRENAITIKSATAGVKYQISGLTFSVSDSKGQIKKSVNAVLDNFTETVRAVNKSNDNAITLQMDAKANQTIRISLTDMRSEALGLKSSDGVTLSVATQKHANAAVNVLDNAIQKALNQQTDIGAVANRMEQTSNNLHIARDNVQASESTIRDADMAKAMTSYTKNNILLQAAQSMLAQANQSSSNVLSLLQ